MNKLIGKQKTRGYFEKVISKKTLGHLYIFEGPRGIGKQTLARHIAALIHCESDNARPCGVCGACVKHQALSHPDLCIVKNTDASKKSIGVETVRSITSDIFVRPLLANHKIYVVPDAHTLSAEAQNALLKVLEEPPAYAVIILLATNAEALLPTVRSRGILCPVEPCTRDETVLYIKDRYPHRADMADMIANLSGGVLGVAGEMAGEDSYFEMRQELYAALSSAVTDPAAQFSVVSCFERHKASQLILFDLFVSWLRDVLYIKTTKGSGLINYDYEKEIREFASGQTLTGALRAAQNAADCISRIGAGSNLALWISDLMISCFST